MYYAVSKLNIVQAMEAVNLCHIKDYELIRVGYISSQDGVGSRGKVYGFILDLNPLRESTWVLPSTYRQLLNQYGGVYSRLEDAIYHDTPDRSTDWMK